MALRVDDRVVLDRQTGSARSHLDEVLLLEMGRHQLRLPLLGFLEAQQLLSRRHRGEGLDFGRVGWNETGFEPKSLRTGRRRVHGRVNCYFEEVVDDN